jgi:hypothetical protein
VAERPHRRLGCAGCSVWVRAIGVRIGEGVVEHGKPVRLRVRVGIGPQGCLRLGERLPQHLSG